MCYAIRSDSDEANDVAATGCNEGQILPFFIEEAAREELLSEEVEYALKLPMVMQVTDLQYITQ